VNDKYYHKDGSVLDYCEISKVLHREDGPAIESVSGSKFWYVDGKLHRLDGPAIEYADGDRYWYIDGKYLTEKEFDNHPKVRHYRFQVLLEEVLRER
jgi:hypothetical protein